MFGSLMVWYNPAESSNVISLKLVKNMFCVTSVSNNRGEVFTVHTNEDPLEFLLLQKGLHYLNLEQYNGPEAKFTMTI